MAWNRTSGATFDPFGSTRTVMRCVCDSGGGPVTITWYVPDGTLIDSGVDARDGNGRRWPFCVSMAATVPHGTASITSVPAGGTPVTRTTTIAAATARSSARITAPHTICCLRVVGSVGRHVGTIA